MRLEQRETGPGCFLIVSYFPTPGSAYPRRAEAALAISEVVGALALSHPGLIGPNIFEGVLAEPGHITLLPEEPMTLSTPVAIDPSVLSHGIQNQITAISRLQTSLRDRFRLAARWFLRGHEAQNPVDKFLFWYISLEVFPSQENTDVVRAVRDLLSSRVYSRIDPGALKERLAIGRISGLRARIVHDGLSHVYIPHEPEFADALLKLEAIATVSLRLLVGLPPGSDLDHWVLV